MKHASVVLGNSSSGIIETPAFHIPTVNIGDRQRGRLQSENILNCSAGADSIVEAMNKALSPEFRKTCQGVISPYGDGHAAERIAEKIVSIVFQSQIELKKSFFNLEETF